MLMKQSSAKENTGAESKMSGDTAAPPPPPAVCFPACQQFLSLCEAHQSTR